MSSPPFLTLFPPYLWKFLQWLFNDWILHMLLNEKKICPLESPWHRQKQALFYLVSIPMWHSEKDENTSMNGPPCGSYIAHTVYSTLNSFLFFLILGASSVLTRYRLWGIRNKWASVISFHLWRMYLYKIK